MVSPFIRALAPRGSARGGRRAPASASAVSTLRVSRGRFLLTHRGGRGTGRADILDGLDVNHALHGSMAVSVAVSVAAQGLVLSDFL
jgi:hypothetical protein